MQDSALSFCHTQLKSLFQIGCYVLITQEASILHIILTIVVAYTFLNIFETLYFINTGGTYFGTDLSITWPLYLATLIFLLGFLFFRKYNQRKYTRIANENIEENYNVKDGTFYYQLPVVTLMDNLPVKVYGEGNPQFELYFNNVLLKISFIFDFSILPPGLKLISKNNTIILKSKHFFRYKYDVYVNNEYYGEFSAKKLIKEGGVRKYLDFDFKSEDREYNLENNYLELTTSIKNQSDTLLTAERSYFNLFSKDEKTGRRGERHNITIENSLDQNEKELLLSLYVAALNIRNFKN